MLCFSPQLVLPLHKNWMHCYFRLVSQKALLLGPDSSLRTALWRSAGFYWAPTTGQAYFLKTGFWLTFLSLAHEICQSLGWLLPGSIHSGLPSHLPPNFFQCFLTTVLRILLLCKRAAAFSLGNAGIGWTGPTVYASPGRWPATPN